LLSAALSGGKRVEAAEGANLAFNRIVAGQVQNDGDPCCQVAYVIQKLCKEFLPLIPLGFSFA
jgi:hypothetical protein